MVKIGRARRERAFRLSFRAVRRSLAQTHLRFLRHRRRRRRRTACPEGGRKDLEDLEVGEFAKWKESSEKNIMKTKTSVLDSRKASEKFVVHIQFCS